MSSNCKTGKTSPPLVLVILYDPLTTDGFIDNLIRDNPSLTEGQVYRVPVVDPAAWASEIKKAREKFTFKDEDGCTWPVSHYIISPGWSSLWKAGSETLTKHADAERLGPQKLYDELYDEICGEGGFTDRFVTQITIASKEVMRVNYKDWSDIIGGVGTLAKMIITNTGVPALFMLEIPPWGTGLVGGKDPWCGKKAAKGSPFAAHGMQNSVSICNDELKGKLHDIYREAVININNWIVKNNRNDWGSGWASASRVQRVNRHVRLPALFNKADGYLRKRFRHSDGWHNKTALDYMATRLHFELARKHDLGNLWANMGVPNTFIDFIEDRVPDADLQELLDKASGTVSGALKRLIKCEWHLQGEWPFWSVKAGPDCWGEWLTEIRAKLKAAGQDLAPPNEWRTKYPWGEEICNKCGCCESRKFLEMWNKTASRDAAAGRPGASGAGLDISTPVGSTAQVVDRTAEGRPIIGYNADGTPIINAARGRGGVDEDSRPRYGSYENSTVQQRRDRRIRRQADQTGHSPSGLAALRGRIGSRLTNATSAAVSPPGIGGLIGGAANVKDKALDALAKKNPELRGWLLAFAYWAKNSPIDQFRMMFGLDDDKEWDDIKKKAGMLNTDAARDRLRQVTANLSGMPEAKRKKIEPYWEHIMGACKKYKIPARWIMAIIDVESSWDPQSVSEAKAGGLMQLMPNTARSLGVTDVFDPKQNIYAGTKYFAGLIYDHPNLKRFRGTRFLWYAALVSYACGPNNDPMDRYRPGKAGSTRTIECGKKRTSGKYAGFHRGHAYAMKVFDAEKQYRSLPLDQCAVYGTGNSLPGGGATGGHTPAPAGSELLQRSSRAGLKAVSFAEAEISIGAAESFPDDGKGGKIDNAGFHVNNYFFNTGVCATAPGIRPTNACRNKFRRTRSKHYCAAFVSWCYAHAYGGSKESLPWKFSGSSRRVYQEILKNGGIDIDVSDINNIKSGDMFCMQWTRSNGSSGGHAEIVYAVHANQDGSGEIELIGGNYHNKWADRPWETEPETMKIRRRKVVYKPGVVPPVTRLYGIARPPDKS